MKKQIIPGFWSQGELELLENFILKSDGYKPTHFPQYPKGTSKIISYLESRGCSLKDKNGNELYDYTTFFGLQYITLRHFCGQQITYYKIKQAKTFLKEYYGTDLMNEEGWKYIVKKYNGYLPLIIKAIPEGSKVPLHNVLMTIENNDPKTFFLNDVLIHWLTNYSETLISQIWYPTTIATNGSKARDIIKAKHDKTCDTTFVDYSLHDFGFRGVSCYEQACIGGMAHLVNFNGTDTMPAIVMANKVYNSDSFDNFKMYGNSVVATEHSTTTSWGRWGEPACIINLLKTFPKGIKSAVGDSYDVEAFANMLYDNEEIRNLILNSDESSKFVLRPDSGDPVEIDLMLLNILWNKFGGTINSKGYKVLNPKIGLLQGDGIDLQMIINILDAMDENGFAASNIVFGSGGGLLQKFDRDTLKFAIKCSSAIINNIEVDVQKDPKTGKGKKSKIGKLALMKDENGVLYTKEKCTEIEYQLGLLEEVFNTGVLSRYQEFDDIRNIARN